MFLGPKPIQKTYIQSKAKIFICVYSLTNPSVGSFSLLVQVHPSKILKVQVQYT